MQARTSRVLSSNCNEHEALALARKESTQNQQPSATQTQGKKWNTGFKPLDDCLPETGFAFNAIHEVIAARADHMPGAFNFAFAMLSRAKPNGTIIWCASERSFRDYGKPYAFGMQKFGLSPSQFIFAPINKEKHLHFAIEEAMKCNAAGIVVAEGPLPDFTGSRRLLLLAKEYNRPCILLGSDHERKHGSAAFTRIIPEPVRGVENPADPFGPGLPTWRVTLARNRGGRKMPGIEATSQSNAHQSGAFKTPYPWRMTWDEQTLSFRSAAVFSGRKASDPQEAGSPDPHQTLVGRTA